VHWDLGGRRNFWKEIDMTHDPNDVVRVAAGELVRMEAYRRALGDAGIDCRLVGDDLGAGLGTIVPDAIEVWVHRSDADRGRPHPHPPHGHPASDPKPARPDVRRVHPHYNPDPRS